MWNQPEVESTSYFLVSSSQVQGESAIGNSLVSFARAGGLVARRSSISNPFVALLFSLCHRIALLSVARRFLFPVQAMFHQPGLPFGFSLFLISNALIYAGRALPPGPAGGSPSR